MTSEPVKMEKDRSVSLVSADKKGKTTAKRMGLDWILPTTVVGGIAVTVLGTLLLMALFPEWSWISLPFHSTLEVAGSAFGLMLAVLILFSQKETHTTRRMWIACALISMAILDICHSCVPAGVSFVWLHSLAVLAGGFFFALVVYPEREISRATALTVSATVLVVTILIGVLSAIYPENLPAMLEEGKFTFAAVSINLLGGGLTLVAAVNFAVRYYRERSKEELLFLILCLLFGVSGILFQLSSAWETGWWFWHVLRFFAYLSAFWLAMLTFWGSEAEMLKSHSENDRLFHTSVDGKRLIDSNYNHLRINETLLEMSGTRKEDADRLKCHELFRGPLCKTDKCPIRQLRKGNLANIQMEVTKIRRDGKKMKCVLLASPNIAPDGSMTGIFESFWDITDRKKAELNLERQNTMKTSQTALSDEMRGGMDLNTLCRKIITFLCKHLAVQTGLVYLADDQGALDLVGSYAHKRRKHLASRYGLGEGLVGQAALEKEEIILTNVPRDYIKIESGLGDYVPRNIYVRPVIHNDNVVAVIELGTLKVFTKYQSQFLNMVSENIAIAIESAKSRTQLAISLEQSQRLSEELQVQQEELKAANEELEEQTRALQQSEQMLKAQQEELRAANEELEEQTQALQQSEERLKAQQEELRVTNEELEEKNKVLEQQTQEVEVARKEIEEKAEELTIASKYKSEFLANMSHELRTPLNSLLLLSRSFAENTEGNLTEEQVESAGVIHASGNDLLSLINEILDLSKIEAGQMDIHFEKVSTRELAENTRSTFQHMAGEKALAFEVGIDEHAPEFINTDRKRLEQIIKNLLSNAIKFTEKGSVVVEFGRPSKDRAKITSELGSDDLISISVTDSGIGIPEKMQKVIFEAFQQVDGSISRRFGGTGLGLSISRELVRILGGMIRVSSEAGRGSNFTVYIPVSGTEIEKKSSKLESHTDRPLRETAPVKRRPLPSTYASVADDRENLESDDTIILIIEDDAKFAKILVDQCRQKKFKCLAAATGEDGIVLVDKYSTSAVILDLKLPGIDGLEVLDILKDNPDTRHIPVHILSASDPTPDEFRKGAIGHLKKPVTREELEEVFSKLTDVFNRKVKSLLLVEDNKHQRLNIKKVIGNGDVVTDEAENAKAAYEALRSKRYDCMILDLMLPDMSGFEFLKKLKDERIDIPPVIVYTAKDLTREEESELRECAESIIIKGVHSEERLLDETALFLHRMVAEMPKKKRKIIADLHDVDVMFKGKKVLIVDDDMRTLFALSKALKNRGIDAIKAEDGKKALEILRKETGIDLILMDIMMPVMDGYETMKRIRSMERWRNVPIIAVTAKAMKGDANRCIEAGANDYMSKPVDVKRLFSMMRVWLYR